MSVVDRCLDNIEDILGGLRAWSKRDHSEFFPIACPHNENILALYNGSLLSVIKVDGYMGQYFPTQFKTLRDEWQTFFRTSMMGQAPFDLFWFHEFDPEGMNEECISYRMPMIEAGRRRNLNSEDVLLEDAALYGKNCAKETQLLLIVTHLDSLAKSDQAKALSARKAAIQRTAKGQNAMVMKVGVKALESIHEQHVNKVLMFMDNEKHKYSANRLDAYDALHAMRFSMYPAITSTSWKARIKPGDVRYRATEEVRSAAKDAQSATGRPTDWTAKLPPKLAAQLVVDAVDLQDFAVMGDRVYAPMHISELASEAAPLEELLEICYSKKVPIRLSFSLMANSGQANYWNRMFASMFPFMSQSNRQISKSDKAIQSYLESEGAVFGYGISATTWTKKKVSYDADGKARYDVSSLEERANHVETMLQQWGGQQIERMHGDAIEATMSATAGYAIPPICPKAPQTEFDAITQLPIMRPAPLWSPELGIWFRSPDGVLLPHQPMSSLQNAMLTLITGGMGFGKSNLLAEHLFYFANHPLAREMAYIRGMDFGSSSRGVIDMIRDFLPSDRKHEAMFTSFVNDGSIAKNILDTRLGLRWPLQDHQEFVERFIGMLCESLFEEAGVANVMSVIRAIVEETYRFRDPSARQSEPRFYEPRAADPSVVEALNRIEFYVDKIIPYWDVADALAKYGIEFKDDAVLQAAKVAQRRAVPEFADLIKTAGKLADRFKSTHKGKPLPEAIMDCLMAANSLFPCLAGFTKTDISESRICVFDMTEVFGRGTTGYDDWKRSVFFMVGMRLLTEDLFVNLETSGNEIILKADHLGATQQVVDFHQRYFEAQDQVQKIFWADEVHRIGKVEGALDLLDSMGLEGRKYGVGLILGTQMPDHLPEKLLGLASTYFVCGTSQNAETANRIQKILNLNDDERDACLNITKPTAAKGSQIFAVFKTSRGVQKLLLHFQMGGIKKWAYATEQDERSLRGILYKNGPSAAWARKVLAENIPDIQVAIKAMSATHAGSKLSKQDCITQIAKKLLQMT